jgi:hypothetical protein
VALESHETVSKFMLNVSLDRPCIVISLIHVKFIPFKLVILYYPLAANYIALEGVIKKFTTH